MKMVILLIIFKVVLNVVFLYHFFEEINPAVLKAELLLGNWLNIIQYETIRALAEDK